MQTRLHRYAKILFSILGVVAVAGCSPGAINRVRYEKREYEIPMRDGVKLFTSVYAPRNHLAHYPIMLLRTPYSVGPYGPDKYAEHLGPSPLFADAGYIFAYQDVRGCYMSQGEFKDMRPIRDQHNSPSDTDESTDTWDTIDWLVRNVSNNNGRVGMWGISYPGFYTAAGMIDSHPALKAVSPQAPIADWFVGDDEHHNGAFFLQDSFGFFASFGRPRPAPTTQRTWKFDYGTPDAYQFHLDMGPLPNANKKYLKNEITYWNEMLQHGSYDDYWKAHNLLPHLRNIRCAVMTVGGWYDSEDLYGPLHIYPEVERNNPGIANTLVMGPWIHGGWARTDGDSLGDIKFGSKTSEYYQREIEMPFFNHYLKDRGADPRPEAKIFETGANKWHSLASWPPSGLEKRAIYFRDGGRLGFDAPTGKDDAEFDEYVSDPAHPVPYTTVIDTRRPRSYMIDDQRFAWRRPDVLTYAGEPLKAPLTIAGPIRAKLFVSTTGTDADFIVKVIDVYPKKMPEPDEDHNPNPNRFRQPPRVRMGGYQMLVRAEVMRGKFRRSMEKPEPFTPGEVTPVEFELRDVCHTFLKGHSVMVQVQSSWFPLVDRNPQTFCDIYAATEADFKKATHRVFHSGEHPSCIEVGVAKALQ